MICPSLRPYTPPFRRRVGFSLMELIVLIALIGVLSSVAVYVVGKQPGQIRNIKLSSDVATLNRMVSAYLADGGSLKGLTKPKDVLEKLKKSRASKDWHRQTGPVSGHLIDLRLRLRETSAPEATGRERAKWNAKNQRFELTKGNGVAIAEFYLDQTTATTAPATDNRAPARVLYNSDKRGWVWGSSATPNFAYHTPGTSGTGVDVPFDPLAPRPTPDDGDGEDGDDGDDGGGDSGTPAPDASRLPRPLILPDGGTYPYAAFPSSVSLSANGAAAAGSELQYRKNGGTWTVHTGAPIPIGPAESLEARNKATDPVLYEDSFVTSAEFYRLTAGFTGTSTATWGNAIGGANLLTEIDNNGDTVTLKHGNTKLDLGNGEFLDDGEENVLSFDQNDLEAVQPNTWFGLGSMELVNGTTFYNSEANAVTLSLMLNLTDPPKSAVVHIDLGLVSTANSGDTNASADVVELRNPNTDFAVTIDGIEYRLELSWESLDPSAGVVQGGQFLVFEGATAKAQLRGRFVSNH